jgi:hypothetical protein
MSAALQASAARRPCCVKIARRVSYPEHSPIVAGLRQACRDRALRAKLASIADPDRICARFITLEPDVEALCKTTALLAGPWEGPGVRASCAS